MTDQESIEILNSLIPPLKTSLLLNHSTGDKTPTIECPITNGHENGATATVNGNAAERREPSGCPFFSGKQPTSQSKKAHLKNPEWQTSMSVASDPVNYNDYLHLDKILNAQYPVSQKYGNLAHDEHLFIVIHQSKLCFCLFY